MRPTPRRKGEADELLEELNNDFFKWSHESPKDSRHNDWGDSGYHYHFKTAQGSKMVAREFRKAARKLKEAR